MPKQYDQVLLCAALEGDLIKARDALTKGANIEVKDEDGSTPLHLAAGMGKFEMVKLLLLYKANIEARSNDGSTPLIDAIRYSDNIEVIKLLLSNHSNVNAMKKDGRTAMDFAIGHKKTAMEKLLLEYMGIVETSNSTKEYLAAFEKLNLKHGMLENYYRKVENTPAISQNINRHSIWYKRPEIILPIATIAITAVVANVYQAEDLLPNMCKIQ